MNFPGQNKKTMAPYLFLPYVVPNLKLFQGAYRGYY